MKTRKKQRPSLGRSYLRLWRGWLTEYRGILFISIILMCVTGFAAAGYAKYIEWVVEALEQSNTRVFYWGPIGIVVLVLIKGVSYYVTQVIQAFALSKMQRSLQRSLYRKLVTMDLAYLMDEPPAALAARFSADVDLSRMAVQAILTSVTGVFTILAAFAVMLSIDWLLTLGVLGVFTLAFVPVGIVGIRVRKISSATQEDIANMTATLNEGLSGIRMVRTYQLEDRLLDQAKGVFSRLYRLRVSLVKYQATLSPLMELLGGIATGLIVFIVALRIQSGDVSLAGFMGLLTAVGIAANPARKLSGAYAMAQQGAAALDRIFALIDTQNTILDQPNTSKLTKKVKGDIKFESVGFKYPDGFEALHDINLHFEAGKTYAFVGRSGAGKSTIFNLLPRLFDPSSGKILIDDKDSKKIAISDLRAQISVVSQDSMLLTGSVFENIKFGRQDASAEEVRAAAKSAAALEFIEQLPNGFETEIDPSSHAFSGGERQRLSIARAILRDAPILLLDEPTSALDAESEARIRDALDELSKDRTTLVIAHRLSTILHSDEIVVLDQGRVIERGTHDDLLKAGGLYSELFNLQFDLGSTSNRQRKRSGKEGAESQGGFFARLFGF